MPWLQFINSFSFQWCNDTGHNSVTWGWFKYPGELRERKIQFSLPWWAMYTTEESLTPRLRRVVSLQYSFWAQALYSQKALSEFITLTGGEDPSKSHLGGSSSQWPAVLKICCWQSSNRFTVSCIKKVLCKAVQGQCFLICYNCHKMGLLRTPLSLPCCSADINSADLGYFPKTEWHRNINNLVYWPFTP